MNRGFALTEFIISIIILSLLVTIGFTCYNHYIAKITGIIDELQVQGNVRYAADFINNLLIESAPSDIRIYDGPSSSNKLRIGKTFFQLIDNELKVNHEITNPSSRDNPLASYITGFQVSEDDGLIKVRLVGGNKKDDNMVSINIVVYMGD